MEAKMNIFINNKFIATTLIFVLAITAASLPLPARERRGSDVVVTLIDGGKVKGELLSVKKDALLVYDNSSRQGKSIELQQVAKVKVLKTFWGLTGLVAGLGVGTGVAGLLHNDSNFYVDEMESSLMIMTLFSLAGMVYGIVKSAPKKIFLAGESSRSVQENLEKLRRYARERDPEKPTALGNATNLK
jgi:hypothetical protein